MPCMTTFDLYVDALRRLAACQRKAAANYRDAGELVSAHRALRISTEARRKADRLEAAGA